MIISRDNVFEVISKAGLKPDKDYGQNYLVVPETATKIVESLEINDKDKVLEIGPGLGSLTHYLSLASKDLTCVDIDERMINFLKIIYPQDNVQLVLSDIRKVDVGGYDKIIGNLPYNITTELVVFLLINAKNVKTMTLMCQSEAFNRFYDLSGENYGPVSVLVHLLGETKKVMTVKPGCFIPAPKCNSTVFTFSRNNSSDYEVAIETYKLTKSLFLSRRKTISNNLMNLLKDKNKVCEVLDKLNISANLRPENISPEQYKELYLLLNKRN